MQQRCHAQVFALRLHKRFFALAGVGQIGLEQFGVKFAAGVVELGVVHHDLFDLLVADHDAELFGAFQQIGALQQGLEHGFAAGRLACGFGVLHGLV